MNDDLQRELSGICNMRDNNLEIKIYRENYVGKGNMSESNL